MSLVTRILIVVCTLLACVGAWDVQRRDQRAARNPVATDLFEIIDSQILSLRQQHYQQAYLQASRTLQNTHGLDGFMEAARLDGVTLRQALRWEFGCPEEMDGGWEVPVWFFSKNGDLNRAFFFLVRESGAWKIDWMRMGAQPEPPRHVSGLRL